MASDDTTGIGAVRRLMRGRDPGEPHRASTPLELLFDLCFVVAVAQAATELHHALGEERVGSGLLGYAMVFFAIWWAWMNFTWFASAYDTDDAPYRVLTLLQMGGVLVLAAGVPAAFERYDFAVIVIGYVIMRLAQVAQWLRAAAQHPAGRPAALRYAAGVVLVQIGWVARLSAPGAWAGVTFAALVVAEIAVPIWAERRRATSWHPGHIADRYGGFTIIGLGEVVAATLVAVQSVLGDQGLSRSVILIAVGGLLLIFGLWWIYFTGAEAGLPSTGIALTWGYAHYVVFAAVGALAAGLDVAIAVAEHHTDTPARLAALAVAVPVVVFMIVLALLHRLARAGAVGRRLLIPAGMIVVLALAFSTPLLGLGGAVLGMGLAVAATLALNLTTARLPAVAGVRSSS